MPTLTRAQLRDGANPPANLTAGDYDFTLTNTAHNIYFSIEGQDALIFNSASITSPVGCSFTSGLKKCRYFYNKWVDFYIYFICYYRHT